MPNYPTRKKDFAAVLTRIDRRGDEETRMCRQPPSAEALWSEIRRLQDAEVDTTIRIHAEVVIE